MAKNITNLEAYNLAIDTLRSFDEEWRNYLIREAMLLQELLDSDNTYKPSSCDIAKIHADAFSLKVGIKPNG